MNHNFHDIESGVSDFLSPLRMACFFMRNMEEFLMNFYGQQIKGYPLVMTNSSPWLSHGPSRNRWFSVLNSMVDLSMANWQCHTAVGARTSIQLPYLLMVPQEINQTISNNN